MDTLTILDRTGDTKLTWDPENAAEREEARRTVADLKAKGYSFFLLDGRPADAVTAGDGAIVVRKLTAAEVVDDDTEPEPESAPEPDATPSGPVQDPSPELCQCGKPKGHRGRCPTKPRNVVAVRPVAGG